jgi:Flp pilus assembly protein TadG
MLTGNQRGQALLLVLVAMGFVLIGALGLAIDASQYYTHRVMAQAAADAAAEAAVMSIFNGTNSAGSAAFSTGSSFTCTTGDARTPCVYARHNGFGSTASDTVTVDFNPTVTVSGVTLSDTDPTNLARVTISRTLQTSFLRLFGTNTGTIRAAGTAGIVLANAPIPIVVTHPSLSGAFSMNGTANITICGGANKSIHVDSLSATAVVASNNTTVDLSRAGVDDDGTCSTGTGASFGNHGGPLTYPGGLLLGTRPGSYLVPSSIINDPLRTIAPPTRPTNTGTMGTKTGLANSVNGCPAAPPKACQLYHPGLWPSGINVQNETGVFAPGVYYVENGGFANANTNAVMVMSTGLADDPDTGQGILVYLTGTGTLSVGGGSDASLTGSSVGGRYKNLLFFEDRNGPANTGSGGHTLGGNGNVTLNGTIYLNNTTMTATTYQNLRLRGSSGSSTVITGQIVVSTLDVGGGGTIRMNLNPTLVSVREVALVK